ncbi:MAG: PEP-CTERM sorting domain-containing protein [Gammaproteobacteria bacterium]|nr:PEP-CTERM sorting domain-containing protein [Gammaproteobacteria bacterium]
MKKQLIEIVVVISMFGATISVNAALLDHGGGVIFDNVSNQYWYQNLTDFTNLSLADQQDDIDDLNIGGVFTDDLWGDWRMAVQTDMENLWDNSADSIANVFTPTGPDAFVPSASELWKGRFDETWAGNPVYVGLAMVFENDSGGRYKFDLPSSGSHPAGTSSTSAWIVADAAPVPVPAAMLLFGTGLVGLAGVTIRRRKK